MFEILREQKLFLNPKKMQFLAKELEVLGHRITDEGIKMDPHKVNSIMKWPTPTNKALLASFIGAVGYRNDETVEMGPNRTARIRRSKGLGGAVPKQDESSIVV